MCIRICRFYVSCWNTCVSCALPVYLLLYFKISLIVLCTFHCKSGIQVSGEIEQYTDSNTRRLFFSPLSELQYLQFKHILLIVQNCSV